MVRLIALATLGLVACLGMATESFARGEIGRGLLLLAGALGCALVGLSPILSRIYLDGYELRRHPRPEFRPPPIPRREVVEQAGAARDEGPDGLRTSEPSPRG